MSSVTENSERIETTLNDVALNNAPENDAQCGANVNIAVGLKWR